MRGNNEFVYSGERSKDELLHFVMRMSGPPVQQVTRVESFEILKANNPIFFIYVGKQSGNLWDNYYIASERNQPHGYFYATSLDVASKHFFIDTTPVILVYKENTHYTFPLSDSHDIIDTAHLNESLHTWITQEKFLTFPKITMENIYQYKQTKKYLVLAVVEENKLNELVTHELEFRDMIEQIIRTKRSKYHDKFQFGWIGNPDLSHSIAMDTLNTPHLLVLNSTTNEHHLPDDDPLEMTPEAVEMFLDSVINQSAQIYGGDFFTVRAYRAWFELKRLLRDMWKGNPVRNLFSQQSVARFTKSFSSGFNLRHLRTSAGLPELDLLFNILCRYSGCRRRGRTSREERVNDEFPSGVLMGRTTSAVSKYFLYFYM